MKRKWIVMGTVLAVAVVLLFGFQQLLNSTGNSGQRSATASSSKVITKTKRHHRQSGTKPAKATPVDWHAPSEPKRAYPDVKKYPKLKIDVSIARQRVYLLNGQHVLYTMLASTGARGSGTPTGNFVIQPERGRHFYNAKSGEGANYWVSFKDHGVYLFHSVPLNRAGHYVKSEAEMLGKTAHSHGCVRLSIADAKWMYEHIPENTPVQIH